MKTHHGYTANLERGFYTTQTASFGEPVVKSKSALRSVVYGARTPMALSGGQPTAALAITCTSFPVRRGFIMTRRSCCVHNPKIRRAFTVFASRSFLVYSLFISMPSIGS